MEHLKKFESFTEQESLNENTISDRLVKIICDRIAKKLEMLSDEEKLNKIAKLANLMDKAVPPLRLIFNFLSFGFAGALITSDYEHPSFFVYYIAMFTSILFNSMGKKLQLFSRSYYDKIRAIMVTKYNFNINKMDLDPFDEEEWLNDEKSDYDKLDSRIKCADDVRYKGVKKNRPIIIHNSEI